MRNGASTTRRCAKAARGRLGIEGEEGEEMERGMRTRMLAALVLTLLVAVGCNRAPPDTKPLFHRGEIVTVRTDGERVMITRDARYNQFHNHPKDWFYYCRISGVRQTHRDGILSADTEVVAYTEVKFWEFELEPCEGGEK